MPLLMNMKPIIAAGCDGAGRRAVGARQAIPQATGPNAVRDLRGAVDIHVHSDPDKVPRVLDGIEAARLAKARGCARSC